MLILKIKKYYFNIFLKKITNTYIYNLISKFGQRKKKKEKKGRGGGEEEEEKEKQRPCEKYIQFCD
jgi:hypothetical protein